MWPAGSGERVNPPLGRPRRESTYGLPWGCEQIRVQPGGIHGYEVGSIGGKADSVPAGGIRPARGGLALCRGDLHPRVRHARAVRTADPPAQIRAGLAVQGRRALPRRETAAPTLPGRAARGPWSGGVPRTRRPAGRSIVPAGRTRDENQRGRFRPTLHLHRVPTARREHPQVGQLLLRVSSLKREKGVTDHEAGRRRGRAGSHAPHDRPPPGQPHRRLQADARGRRRLRDLHDLRVRTRRGGRLLRLDVAGGGRREYHRKQYSCVHPSVGSGFQRVPDSSSARRT